MTRRTLRRYALIPVLPVCAALLGASTGSVAIGSPSPTVPRQDSFTGHITFANGRFAGDRGRVTIFLKTDHSGGRVAFRARRKLTVVLEGRRCRSTGRCIRLTGTLTGTLIAQKSIPDTGIPFKIAAHGRIRPLGHISASGTVRGTGFIFSAHEPLHLTLSALSGRVAIHAKSGKVPGFTSP